MTERLLSQTVPIVKVDGTARGELVRDLIRLEIEEDTSGLRTLKLLLLAVGPTAQATEQEQLLYLDGRIFDFGRSVTVAIGPPDTERTVFDGWISAIEVLAAEGEAPQVRICAEDKLMTLRMTRRMRSYTDVSDADVAERIASEHGLGAEVDAPGPTYDVLQQLNMSDLAFLRDRARRIQAEVWVEGETLHFKSRQNRGGTSVTLVQGNELTRCRIRADLAHQRTSVHVHGFDATRREAIDEEATGDVVAEEVSGGRTGPSVLSQAFGDRVSYRARDVALTSEEARDWARAEMLRRARGFVMATGTTSGTPDMVVGSLLTLSGVGGPFDGGPYYVTRMCHTYDTMQGFRTEFAAERATINEVS